MAQFSGPVAVLADRKARPFWAGHRWVFSGALAHQLEGLPAGTVVELRDSRDQVLDFGLWSPRSALRIRLLGIGPVWPFEERRCPTASGRSGLPLPSAFVAGSGCRRLRRIATGW